MQRELDFGVYATAQCNHARAKNAPPRPDRDGLFDIEGVTIICGRRQCHAEPGSDLFATVQFEETNIPLTAIAPGRWDPVAILSACTRAHGNRVYAIDCGTAKPKNRRGLHELLIASIVGADGLRPYLSKRGKHGVGKNANGVEKILEPWPTWAIRMVLLSRWQHGSAYNVRRALRALEDAGLVSIELGPNNRMTRAKVEWLPRALLAPQRLDAADDEVLGALA